jgi:AcrR family transcriptional regulator
VNVRESILAAGITLLKQRGIAALTQPQVAKAAGIKQSHLTYYFPTRAELLMGVADESIRTTMAELATRLTERTQAATLAASVAEIMIAGVPPRVMVGLIVAADADPEIRKPLRKLIRHIRAQVQAVLSKAGLGGSVDAALLFHATVVGLAVMHQAQKNSQSAREAREGVAAMLRLLAPPNQDRAMRGSR